jgi:trimethylamine---corrinoid protein Co-methyltransferase
MSSSLRPRTALLSPEDTEGVVEDAMRVLEKVGILSESHAGRDLLLAGGASEQAGRLRIPERLVRESLASAPAEIQLYDREGEPALLLAGDNVHFDPGSAAINVIDPDSGRRRAALSGDLVDLARLVDGLPNYAAQSTALVPGDVPEAIGDRHRFYLALRHGRKPIITGTFLKEGFAPMLEMQQVFRRDAADLRARPLAVFDCCPSPPLKWSDLTCQCLIDCARSGVPAELVSMPLTGATSPVTLREAVVQHCAENLSGIVIHQLAGPGSPIIYGGAPSAFDMRHGSTPMGAVETMMIHLAYAQVGKFLGLPTHGYLGLSDAKTGDYQAGMESGIGAVLGALAGINVISGAGALDYILTLSLPKLLLDHESCGMALRMVRGIERRAEDPVELIGELVRTGEFLSHRHTRKYWREELSVASPLIDRDSFGDWQAKGELTALERARAEVKRRLDGMEESGPAAEPATELEAIMKAEAARFGLANLPG